eukprot:gene16355-21257_t
MELLNVSVLQGLESSHLNDGHPGLIEDEAVQMTWAAEEDLLSSFKSRLWLPDCCHVHHGYYAGVLFLVISAILIPPLGYFYTVPDAWAVPSQLPYWEGCGDRPAGTNSPYYNYTAAVATRTEATGPLLLSDYLVGLVGTLAVAPTPVPTAAPTGDDDSGSGLLNTTVSGGSGASGVISGDSDVLGGSDSSDLFWTVAQLIVAIVSGKGSPRNVSYKLNPFETSWYIWDLESRL